MCMQRGKIIQACSWATANWLNAMCPCPQPLVVASAELTPKNPQSIIGDLNQM